MKNVTKEEAKKEIKNLEKELVEETGLKRRTFLKATIDRYRERAGMTRKYFL